MERIGLDVTLIGIARGFTLSQIGHVVPALLRGGLKHLEITMNSPGALSQIEEARKVAGGRLQIGAGTVTNRKLLEQALRAGATFIVTPTLNEEVLVECVRRKIPVFPGAFSPTEIYRAWELGATAVKIFPADLGGPAYVRSLRGPFLGIKLLPTGGVDLESVPLFVKAGASGLGIGSPLLDRQRIEAGDWAWVEDRTRSFVAAFRNAARS